MTVNQDELVRERAPEILPGDVPGGPSTSQTMMVASLQQLLESLPPDAPPGAYRSAVMEDNQLAKATSSGREWAFRQLRRFYALDPSVLLFRALRDLWDHDRDAQPQLAVLCAMARDAVLRASSALVVATEPGKVLTVDDFEAAIEDAFPGAYKDSTRRTTAQKVASSWTQSGHLFLERPTRKARTRIDPHPSSVAYALLLGHLEGRRGEGLFDTVWAKILDRPSSRLSELAGLASQLGMLEYRSAGGVVEVSFSFLLRPFDDVSGGEIG